MLHQHGKRDFFEAIKVGVHYIQRHLYGVKGELMGKCGFEHLIVNFGTLVTREADIANLALFLGFEDRFHSPSRAKNARRVGLAELEGAAPVERQLGALAVATSFLFSSGLPLPGSIRGGMLVPTALSTGGTSITLRGRVGDVPILGAGLFAGPFGASAATGVGERIVAAGLGREVHDWLASGVSAQDAAKRGVDVVRALGGDIGLIVITRDAMAAAADAPMPWAARTLGSEAWMGPSPE